MVRPRYEPVADAIAAFARAYPSATFVQIGANDGVAHDPLKRQIERHRGWNGLMIEPVPYVFARLAQRYGSDDRIILEQCAIDDIEGTRTLYHVREAAEGEEVWPWYHALGSFRREVLMSHTHLIPDIADRLVETEVPCTRISTLLDKHQIKHVDLIHIDTEGYDYEILKLIDFDVAHPRLITYEHAHLNDTDRSKARSLLSDAGYLLFDHGLDTLALHESSPEQLRNEVKHAFRQR